MFVFVPKPKWPNNEKYLFSPLHILTPWFLKSFPVWPNSMHFLPPPVPLTVRTCARDFATLPALARIYRLIGVVYLRKGLATQIYFETPDSLPPFAFDKSLPASSVGGGAGRRWSRRKFAYENGDPLRAGGRGWSGPASTLDAIQEPSSHFRHPPPIWQKYIELARF